MGCVGLLRAWILWRAVHERCGHIGHIPILLHSAADATTDQPPDLSADSATDLATDHAADHAADLAADPAADDLPGSDSALVRL